MPSSSWTGDRLPIIGGPCDGLHARRSTNGEYVWIDLRGRRRFRDHRGAHQYKQVDGEYRYVELQMAHCTNCGVIHHRPLFEQVCGLCGGRLA